LETHYSFKIYNSTANLPENWNDLAVKNIFLSQNYLKVLEFSAPKNMICNYIGLFADDNLVGIALSQMVSSIGVSWSGEKKNCLQSKVRDFVFDNYASNVLMIGNNMLTGQNAFCISNGISCNEALFLLKKATHQLETYFKKNGKKIHITTFKDFDSELSKNFNQDAFSKHYKFEIQPNMVFDIPENWHTNDDYFNALSKKYRDQYKRARKKSEGIEKRKMNLQEIELHQERIYELYYNVTKNAPFNTFYLAKNHFVELKKQLENDFLFYGYFIDNQLIGFNTLIKNGFVIDTYFLGYDDACQRDKMLYLNMLYDMIGYSINKNFKKIIFARTALEIKSSVGAKPEKMFGFMRHKNSFLNSKMDIIFNYLEPKTNWKERNPYK
jgi:hypothetical protein